MFQIAAAKQAACAGSTTLLSVNFFTTTLQPYH
jgi:hypothetical protein